MFPLNQRGAKFTESLIALYAYSTISGFTADLYTYSTINGGPPKTRGELARKLLQTTWHRNCLLSQIWTQRKYKINA